MPPLMLSTDEAVAMNLALAAMRRRAAPEPTEPTEPTGRVGDADESAASTALAKLVRVLPGDVATRVAQVLTAVSAPMESAALGPAPNPTPRGSARRRATSTTSRGGSATSPTR